MKSGSWLLALALSAGAGLAGCGDDDDLGSCGIDAGAHPRGQAGHDAGPLVWIPKDAGTAGKSGSGGSSSAPVAGSSADTRMCARARQPLPAALLPRCSAQTRDCVAACPQAADPDMCRAQCLNADPTPPDPTYGADCAGCVYLQLFACVDRANCHEGVADVFCCIEENCPAGSPEGCGEQRCGQPIRTALTCGYYADMACLDYLGSAISSCFAADDADAGAQ